MKLRKSLCYVGIHKYRTIDLTDCFTTTYTDRNWFPIKHIVYYLKCECCGKRSFKSTYKNDVSINSHHSGIEYAKVGWIEYNKMYLGPENKGFTAKHQLKVIQGDKN